MLEEKILQILLDMQKDISALKQDVSGLKQDVSGLKQDVSGLKQDMQEVKDRLANNEKGLLALKNQRMIDSHNIAQILKVQIEMNSKLKEQFI